MSSYIEKIKALTEDHSSPELRIETMGQFQVYLNNTPISTKVWGRDKTLQLLQFLVTSRHRRGLHKEQIIDRLWEESNGEVGDRDFKVALHGINKALEPHRKSRTEPRYIHRQGLTYQLDLDRIWLDIKVIEELISIGNEVSASSSEIAQKAYSEAIKLYKGPYMPNRMYEDWSSEERERIQVLILNTLVTLAELVEETNPIESIRLCQKALQIDQSWEEAYRIQMAAYIHKGNRPQALKTYSECERILDKEFGIDPLPQTKALLRKIEMIGI